MGILHRGLGFLAGGLLFFTFLVLSLPGWSMGGRVALEICFGVLLLLIPFLGLRRENTASLFLSWAISVLGVLYVVLPFALLLRLSMRAGEYDWRWILFPMVMIWANDTGAFVFGSLFGSHKLLERVSPGKTWEGFVGGILVTAGIGILVSRWAPGYGRWYFGGMLGVLISVSSTLGDLVESQLKRSVHVKDSGRFLPGHGGFLDRFDSLLFTAPFVTLYFTLLHVLIE